MTDSTDTAELRSSLSPVVRRFILHWGEMGTRWGVNRTMAQIHALLFISPTPLPADVISATLDVARSNVSVSLRELQAWGIVRLTHVLGDRRDHFESHKDVWEMFRIILDERKRREIDPTLALLRECAAEVSRASTHGGGAATARDRRKPRKPVAASVALGTEADAHTAARLGDLLEFFEAAATIHREYRALPTSAVRRLARSARRIRQLLGSSEGS